MKIKAVIGANWGDEGKGLMSNYFSLNSYQKSITVCANGGSQRGHTVITPSGERYVFHHFGSGSFSGSDTYFGEKYILNPMNFRKEYKEIIRINPDFKVYVHPKCLWSTPYDLIINSIISDEKHKENIFDTCGAGIWETIVRNSNLTPIKYRLYPSISDLRYVTVGDVKNFLVSIRDEYVQNRIFNQLNSYNIPIGWNKILKSVELMQNFIIDLSYMMIHIKIADYNVLQNYENVIFENGQGLMLDDYYSKDPDNSTPSRTGLKNISNIISSLEYDDAEICYVTRTYATRHGHGLLPNECLLQDLNSGIYDETNNHNDFQGGIRYGKLDFINLQKRINIDFNSNKKNDWKCSLAITHINELNPVGIEQIFGNFDKIYSSDCKESEKVKIEK